MGKMGTRVGENKSIYKIPCAICNRRFSRRDMSTNKFRKDLLFVCKECAGENEAFKPTSNSERFRKEVSILKSKKKVSDVLDKMEKNKVFVVNPIFDSIYASSKI